MTDKGIEKSIGSILAEYQNSFTQKIYDTENNDYDILMEVFGIPPDLKRENRQYWGRELGMCWQRIVVDVFQNTRNDFSPALKVGKDEPCDLIVGAYGIDTKYRIGSGDSGTLKKFKQYGRLLKDMGYMPILLMLREDNLPAAIKACEVGGWEIFMGNATFGFIFEQTDFDLRSFLREKALNYEVER